MSEIENWSSIGRVSMTNWIFTRKKLCIDFDFRLIALQDKVIYLKNFKHWLCNLYRGTCASTMYIVAYFHPKKYSLKSKLTAWLLCRTTCFAKLSILSTINTNFILWQQQLIFCVLRINFVSCFPCHSHNGIGNVHLLVLSKTTG